MRGINIQTTHKGCEMPTGKRELFLRECKSEAGLWKIIDRYVDDGKEIVRGWMVTYVDDLLVERKIRPSNPGRSQEAVEVQ